MKFIAAFRVLLIVSSVQAGDKDIIKDRSPDRKFALRLTKGDEGWAGAIIDLKSNDDVVGWRSIKITATCSLNRGTWYGRKIPRESPISNRIVAAGARRFIFE